MEMKNSQRRTPTPPAGGRRGTTAAAKHSGNEDIRKTSAEPKQKEKKPEMSGDGGFRRVSPLTPINREAPRRSPTPSRSSARTPSPYRPPWRSPSPSRPPWRSPSPSPLVPARKSPARTERALASTKPQDAKTDAAAAAKPRSMYLIRTMKAPTIQLQDEEYHRYRVVYNTLMQWRFANARLETAMEAAERTAQKKVVNVWMHNTTIRTSTTEKRTQLQKLQHGLKLYEILKISMELLEEWSRIEQRNVLGVGRVVRKLSAISICLPLEDAEGDTESIRDAMVKAMAQVENMKAMIVDMKVQVENTCILLRKLFLTLIQQIQFFQKWETKANVAAP